MYHFPHFVWRGVGGGVLSPFFEPTAMNSALIKFSGCWVGWPRQHLDTVTYHNCFWLHICPSCHTESQTWALFYSRLWSKYLLCSGEKKQKPIYFLCWSMDKLNTSSHSTVWAFTLLTLVRMFPHSIGSGRARLKYPAFLLGGAYAEFQGSIL